MVPAQEATRLTCASTHAPSFGIIWLSHARIDSEILLAHAVWRFWTDASRATRFVAGSNDGSRFDGTAVTDAGGFVSEPRDGKNRSRNSTSEGRAEIHRAMSS